ncbi:MAG: leucine-rich repeat domain-containing protein [Ignavibacteria bacterium]|jgi:hypothetical protein|nr:leucine-rich repeat domain-containing protein [Ignavibacteria bacterium]
MEKITFNSMPELLKLFNNNPEQFKNMKWLEVKSEVVEKDWLKCYTSSIFHHCQSLQSVYFPDATVVGKAAFNGCYFLSSIEFPNAISIGEEAFCACEHLKSVSFPKVTSIMFGAFRGCSMLTCAKFPNVTSIEQNAFGDCENLADVYLGAEIFEFADIWNTFLFFPQLIRDFEHSIFVMEEAENLTPYTENVTLHLLNPAEYAKANGNEWRGYKWKNILKK